MADHVQQQILEAVEAALKAAATPAGNRVFLDLLDPLEDDQLPAIVVLEAAEGEQIEPQTVNGLEQRQFAVSVQCMVTHSTDYARQARALGAAVERVLGAPRLSIPKPGRARLRASRITLIGDADRAVASREQTWQFTYYTRRGEPDVAH